MHRPGQGRQGQQRPDPRTPRHDGPRVRGDGPLRHPRTLYLRNSHPIRQPPLLPLRALEPRLPTPPDRHHRRPPRQPPPPPPHRHHRQPIRPPPPPPHRPPPNNPGDQVDAPSVGAER